MKIENIQINKKTSIKIILSIILAIIMVIVSLTTIQPQIFAENAKTCKEAHVRLNVIFLVFEILQFYFIINFIDKILIEKERFYRKWLKHFLIYLAIMGIFLLIMWPGHWVWDEFGQLNNAKYMNIDTWQSYITIIYMSICLMIIPFPAGILIIQNILISVIISWVISKVSSLFNEKNIIILLYLFMLTPAVIINNFYPLRLTMYTYVLLIFICNMMFDFIEKKDLTITKFIGYTLLNGLLMLWRSEGVIFLLIEPILLSIAYKNINKKIISIIIMIIINVLVIKGYNLFIKSLNYDADSVKNTYSLTMFINPLSEMLQNDLKGKNIEQDLENINKVLDINVMRKYHGYEEILSYWLHHDELIQDNWEEHLGEFKKSYIKIIINNPISFLKARMKTFLATSCNYEGNFAHVQDGSTLLDYYASEGVKTNAFIKSFFEKYKYTQALNKDLKLNVESFLMGKNFKTNECNTIFIVLFWDIIPVLALVAMCFIISLFKKKKLYFVIFGTLLTNFGVIFLTVPAIYFMYYVPFYICGVIISLIFIVDISENNTKMIEEKNDK